MHITRTKQDVHFVCDFREEIDLKITNITYFSVSCNNLAHNEVCVCVEWMFLLFAENQQES